MELVERETPTTTEQWVFRNVNESELCPPDYSQRGFGNVDPYLQSVYWTLLDDRADQFYADIFRDTAIAQDKLALQDRAFANLCPPSAEPGDGDACWGRGWDYGLPVPSGYSESDVTDPKDIVQKALDNSGNLAQQVSRAVFALQIKAYEGDDFELIDAISMPVLMIAQAVDSMGTIETVADEIEAAKRKAIILAFLGALFFFIPIAGEVIGSLTELAGITTLMTVIGVAGDIALDAYTIADDPDNAPLAIFDLILAPLGLGDLGAVAKAANIRRGMSVEQVTKLGTVIGSRLGTVSKVKNACTR